MALLALGILAVFMVPGNLADALTIGSRRVPETAICPPELELSPPRTEIPEPQATLEPPNIVFLLADDLGYGDVGYNGGRARTPYLDEMASGPHSIHFNRFYSGGPVCSPTRGTLLTGRNHNRYCLWRANTAGECGSTDTGDFTCPTPFPLPKSEITVAEVLKTRGYRTAVFGKWHLGDLKSINGRPTSHPGQHGFDVWKVTERSAPTVNLNCACFNTSLCVIGHYKKKALPPCTNYHGNYGTSISSGTVISNSTRTTLAGSQNSNVSTVVISHSEPIIGDDSDFLASEFASFLNSTAGSGIPFFAYIPFHTVHKRYLSLKSYSKLYKNLRYTSNEVDYYGAITAMDDAIGKIRRLLSEYGVSNNTMIWFTSDNGPESKSPGSSGGLRGKKKDLLEGGIRVPGIVEWPAAIRRNKVTNFPVSTTDFLPTVCDVLGVDVPRDRPIDGMSILPFIRNKINVRTNPLMWAFNIKSNFSSFRKYELVMSTNRYKAVVTYRNGKWLKSSRALYDLLADPGEENNLSSRCPTLLNRMTGELELWRQSLIASARDEVACL